MPKNLASYIDHTLLSPVATRDQITNLVREAKEYKFRTVCVNPCWVSYVANELQGSGVGVTTVVGFPLGANETALKVEEAKLALAHGATEIDMVINQGHIKSAMWNEIATELKLMREVTTGRVLKVIIETANLTVSEIEHAARAVLAARADFVKTSTGFSTRGASVEDIALIKKATHGKIAIKAAGGVRSKTDLVHMIEAGATRIGTSAGVKILTDQTVVSGY